MDNTAVASLEFFPWQQVPCTRSCSSWAIDTVESSSLLCSGKFILVAISDVEHRLIRSYLQKFDFTNFKT